jgi:acyl-CoA dehydrogenase
VPMNVKPVPTLDDRINDIRGRTAEIVNADILPNEAVLWADADRQTRAERVETLELRAAVKEKVKQAGLWAPHLPKEYGGMGLDFLSPRLHERGARLRHRRRSLFGVVAPNSGNQSILVKYGTEEQKEKWLLPLIEGRWSRGSR